MALAAVFASLVMTIVLLPGANGCQGEFNGSGALTSPGYPSMYPRVINCTWSLLASPGYNVFLRLESLDRLKCCGVSCRGSGSRVVCDLSSYRSSKVITAPFNLTAGHDTIFSVVADGLDIGVAFQFMFTSVIVPGCGGVLRGSGSFSSPLYPKAYENFVYCKWILHAFPTDGYILMQILNFRSERNFDFLRVYGNGTLLEQFHGSVNATDVILDKEATVVFETDHLFTDVGFYAQFQTVSSLDVPILRPDSVRLISGCHFINVTVRNATPSDSRLTASYYEIWISSTDATPPISYMVSLEKLFYAFNTTSGVVYNVTVCPVAAWEGVNRLGVCATIVQNSGALQAVAILKNGCVDIAIKSTHSDCTLPEIAGVTCENNGGSQMYSTSATICSLQPKTRYNCSVHLKDYPKSLDVFLTTPKANQYQNVDGLTFPCWCKTTDACQLNSEFCNSSCDDASWGPGCQVGEVINQRVSVEQSSTEQNDEATHGAHLAIDGDELTCSRTAPFMTENSWWSATFVNSEAYFIQLIKVVTGVGVKRLTLLLSNTSETAMSDNSSWIECPLANASSTVFTCQPHAVAKKIAVYSELHSSASGLAICEVSAFGYFYQKCTNRSHYGPGCLMRRELPNCAPEQSQAANRSERKENDSAGVSCVEAKQLHCCKDASKSFDGINDGRQCLNVSATTARWKINHSQMSKTLAQLKAEKKDEFNFYKIPLHDNFVETYIEAKKFPLQTSYTSTLCTVLYKT